MSVEIFKIYTIIPRISSEFKGWNASKEINICDSYEFKLHLNYNTCNNSECLFSII